MNIKNSNELIISNHFFSQLITDYELFDHLGSDSKVVDPILTKFFCYCQCKNGDPFDVKWTFSWEVNELFHWLCHCMNPALHGT